MPKVIDVGRRAFWRFFAIVHRLGFFEEARGRGIEPVILFMADGDPRTEKALTLLRCSFPGHSRCCRCASLRARLPDDEADSPASSFAASLDIAELPSSLRSLVDRPGLLFRRFPAAPARRALSIKARAELLTSSGRFTRSCARSSLVSSTAGFRGLQ